ncbi:hypothetical protein BJ875DRAFT_441902 [Amylocarpus encephaloides]|uniref:Uncharacterized protein n=1 Tax=Amylocarpus encephaloides TaxID=45428 RepID=A0A9P8C681_9HELO|nr:hypothetical protein BJ875DRAFT_441902 [Amylocarpus encephaloides]
MADRMSSSNTYSEVQESTTCPSFLVPSQPLGASPYSPPSYHTPPTSDNTRAPLLSDNSMSSAAVSPHSAASASEHRPSRTLSTPGNVVARTTLGGKSPGVKLGPAVSVAPRGTKRHSTPMACAPGNKKRKMSILKEDKSTVIGIVTPDNSLSSARTSSSGATSFKSSSSYGDNKIPIKQEGSSQGSRRPSLSPRKTTSIKRENNSSNTLGETSQQNSVTLSHTIPKKSKPILKRKLSHESGDADDEQSHKKKRKKGGSSVSRELPYYEDIKKDGSPVAGNEGGEVSRNVADENDYVPGDQQADEESESDLADVEESDDDIFNLESTNLSEMLDDQYRHIREYMMIREVELARERAEAIHAEELGEVSNIEDAQEHHGSNNDHNDGKFLIYEDSRSPDPPDNSGRIPSNSSNQTDSSKENRTETPEPGTEDGEEDGEGNSNENDQSDGGEDLSSELQLDLDGNNESTSATRRQPLKEIRKAKAAVRKEKKRKGSPKKMDRKDLTLEIEDSSEESSSGNGSPTPAGKSQCNKKPYARDILAVDARSSRSRHLEEELLILVQNPEPPESVPESDDSGDETPKPVGKKRKMPRRTANGTPHPKKRPTDDGDPEYRKDYSACIIRSDTESNEIESPLSLSVPSKLAVLQIVVAFWPLVVDSSLQEDYAFELNAFELPRDRDYYQTLLV